MIPDSISRDDVLRALEEFDEYDRGSGRYDDWVKDGRFKHAIAHEGKLYPPKQILVRAGDLERTQFSGGLEANEFLQSRGFTVTAISDESGPDLRSHLQRILDEYVEARQSAPFSSSHPLWQEFEEVKRDLDQSRPVEDRSTLRVKWSAGQGNWAYLPWIALFDERETTTIQDGVYCVYLFRQDMSGVYLTLNQGVTRSRHEHGRARARELLGRRAEELRDYCRGLEDAGFELNNSIDLRTEHRLGIDYEHSTVAHKFYESQNLPDDADLLADLGQVLSGYDRYLRSDTVRRPRMQPREELGAVVSDFGGKLRRAGLTFGADHDAFVRDFVVSLATKQLVILTGLSGSGKTQIALQFGRWLSGADEKRYRVVPVRPDWTGPEALFGYEDALQEVKAGRKAWHVPGPLKFMLRAARDEEHPYLMVLDEMNLAHVERYFADVISGMESDEPCLPNLREEDGTWRKVPGDEAPEMLPFPDNLFIAGTVNVDETTYMFSPKVLDRANTLEFRVETEDLQPDIRRPGACEPGDPALVRGFLQIASDDGWHLENPPREKQRFVDRLKDLHRELDSGFSFGHRVLYEAVRYAALHQEAGGASMEDALDVQILQKVLPRIHGSRRRVESVLRTVGKFCWDLEPTGDEGAGADGFDPTDEGLDPDTAALPRSFDKVQRMTERLRANQFVSFTE